MCPSTISWKSALLGRFSKASALYKITVTDKPMKGETMEEIKHHNLLMKIMLFIGHYKQSMRYTWNGWENLKIAYLLTRYPKNHSKRYPVRDYFIKHHKVPLRFLLGRVE